ncbi:MAG: hypothetical protein DRH57_04815 [Candidatus Cloacimonadota bacterium]|nr:MAG: hypothetical protein DRH57_04815 [Candidatus Cloacimonadota bacterium]
MRIYHFGNFYFSSIQQGIQASHCQMELFNKYIPHPYNGNEVDDCDQINQLWDWSNNHKTMICLNGGMNSDLIATKAFFEDESNPYPWSTFYESEEAMGGMLSNVCIVLPEKIYEMSALLRKFRLSFSDIDIMDNKSFATAMEDAIAILKERNAFEPIETFGAYSKDEIKMAQFMGNFGLAK